MRWSLVGYWVECCEEREASWAAAHRSVEVPGPGGGDDVMVLLTGAPISDFGDLGATLGCTGESSTFIR